MMAMKILLLALLFFAGSAVMAQDCLNILAPCLPFLNNPANPSTQCCSSIKNVLDTQLTCLCGLLNNKELLKGINVTQVLKLPMECGINKDTSVCNATPPTPATPTPGTNSTPTPNKDGASSIPWMGMSGLVTLFLFFWSIIG